MRLEAAERDALREMAALRIQCAIRRSLAKKKAAQARAAKMIEARRQTAAATLIQSHVRAHQQLLRYRRRQSAAVLIQSRFRAHCDRSVFKETRRACIHIQAAFRRSLAMRLAGRLRDENLAMRRAAAVACIERCVHSWIASRRRREDAAAATRVASTVRIQSAWRGHLVRRACSTEMQAIRRRFIAAAVLGRQHPELRIGNRAREAIITLMESKRLSEALQGCTILEQSSSYSHIICELLVSSHAVPKLFRFIRSCNRSKPHTELLVNILSILNNIAQYHWLVGSIFETPGGVLTLVEQLQTFRDKREPYVLCIGILTKVFTCHRRRAAFPREEMVEVNRRVGLIIEYHARRAAMERKCIAYAKPGTSVAFLVEAKRKLRDSIFQGDSLAAMAKLIASST